VRFSSGALSNMIIWILTLNESEESK